MSKSDDVAISKVLAAGKNAAEQDCGIDGRDFRVPYSFAGIDIGKVKEEAAMRWQLLPKTIECRNHAQACILMRDETALFCNADCSQSKTGGRNACHDTGVRCAHVAAIFNQPGLRIGLLPEEEKSLVFKIFQKLLILLRKDSLCRNRYWLSMPSVRLLSRGRLRPHRKGLPFRERQADGDDGH